MTTKTEQDPDAAVMAAEEEAQAAGELVDALEQRVIDGDDTVTAEQIEQQRGLSRWAKLRAEAARRKAEATRAAALERKQEAARAEARALLAAHPIEKLGELHNAAVAALVALIDGHQVRSGAIREVAQILGRGEVPVEQVGSGQAPYFDGQHLHPATQKELERAVLDVIKHVGYHCYHERYAGRDHSANPMNAITRALPYTHGKGTAWQAAEALLAEKDN